MKVQLYLSHILMFPHPTSCLLAHGNSCSLCPRNPNFHLTLSSNGGLNAYSLGDQNEQPYWNAFHMRTKNAGHHLRNFSNLGHVTRNVGSWGTSPLNHSRLTISCTHRRQGSRNRCVTHCLLNACRTLSLGVINSSKTGV